MSGQNQYDPGVPLTSHPTRSRRPIRLADPERFPGASPSMRPVVLLSGGALLLAALLAGMPRDVPSIALGTLAGGAWLSIVLGMTLPSREERAGMELSRRLGVFRHEVNAAGDEPTRDDLERLLALAQELRLKDDEVADDLARIRASLGALALRDELRAGVWPVAISPDPLSLGDVCHFMCPVRFGRRRADQYGHLVLTRTWLKFRGALDMSVAWSEVISVGRDGRDVLVSLHDSRRELRFACYTLEEASRAGIIAAELSRLSAEAPIGPGQSSYLAV